MSFNQACVANSLHGWAMRATILPTAAAICERFSPNSASLVLFRELLRKSTMGRIVGYIQFAKTE